MKILVKQLLVCIGIVCAAIIITSCSTNKFLAKTPDGNNIDVRLVGGGIVDASPGSINRGHHDAMNGFRAQGIDRDCGGEGAIDPAGHP